MITKVSQKMRKLNLLRSLENYPIFNLKIVRETIEKDRNYSKLVIYRLKKEKLIFEIERNKYTIQKDPIVIASNIIWPSYISCWSALRYHNLTEQLPQAIFVITTRARKKKEIKFENIKIIFTKTKSKYFFGYNKENYQDFYIFIADKEKALIDSALFKKISFSELINIIKNNIKNINIELLINYLIVIKNKALIKRFGYIFDELGLDKKKRLKKYIDFKYVALDYALPMKGKKNKEWRIIDNVN